MRSFGSRRAERRAGVEAAEIGAELRRQRTEVVRAFGLMGGFARWFEPSGFFVLRSPLLPADAWFAALTSASSDDAATACRSTRRWLWSSLSSPIVSEAIRFASPSLHGALGAAGADEPEPSPVDVALFQYLTRMSTRSTPFGLFAGSSWGVLAQQTALELGPRAAYRPQAAIKPSVLCAVVQALLAEPRTRRALRLERAPSLHEVAGQLRYAQLALTRGAPAYSLLEVEPTPAVSAVLELAAKPQRLEELAAEAARELQLSSEVALSLVEDLASAGLLVPSLIPAVIGPSPLGPFLEALEAEPAFSAARGSLSTAAAAIRELNAGALAVQGALSRAEESLGGLVELPEPRLHLDLLKPTTAATLGPAPVIELLRVAELLHAVPAPAYAPLARFAEAFTARFDQREVPLVEALDLPLATGGDEVEVPFLHDLGLEGLAPQPASWTERDRFVAPLLLAALREGRPIELRLGDRDERTSKRPAVPDAFVAKATLLSRSAAAVDRGEFLLQDLHFSTPAAAIMSRLGLAEPALLAQLEAHVRREEALAESAGTIVADVAHLSSGPDADVQLRPSLYRYQVVCGGRSVAEPELQIPARDLLVSVRAGQILLRSARLGRRVLPRVASVHAASADPSEIYRFLWELQNQEGVIAQWSWGVFAGAEVLPRVVAGRSILAPASWNLPWSRLAPVDRAAGAGRRLELDRIREGLAIPRWVAAVEGDNALSLDLHNPVAIAACLRLAQRAGTLRLREIDPEAPLLLCGPEGRFLHELVVPFVRRPEPREAEVPSLPAVSVPADRRSFAPGGEVLSAKIFSPRSLHDELVLGALRPFAAAALGRGIISQWYFLRYDEGGPQLRLRLFGDRRLWSELMPELREALSPWISTGRIQRLELDTYEREVERYGGLEGVTIAERIFHADSEACLGLLEMLQAHGEGPADRCRLLALSWEQMLTDLGFAPPERLKLYLAAKDAFAAELEAQGLPRPALAKKARALMQELEPLVTAAPRAEPLLAAAAEILERRSAPLRAARLQLDDARSRGVLRVSPLDYALSQLHLCANRLLNGAARIQEEILHDALARSHRAAAARLSKG